MVKTRVRSSGGLPARSRGLEPEAVGAELTARRDFQELGEALRRDGDPQGVAVPGLSVVGCRNQGPAVEHQRRPKGVVNSGAGVAQDRGKFQSVAQEHVLVLGHAGHQLGRPGVHHGPRGDHRRGRHPPLVLRNHRGINGVAFRQGDPGDGDFAIPRGATVTRTREIHHVGAAGHGADGVLVTHFGIRVGGLGAPAHPDRGPLVKVNVGQRHDHARGAGRSGVHDGEGVLRPGRGLLVVGQVGGPGIEVIAAVARGRREHELAFGPGLEQAGILIGSAVIAVVEPDGGGGVIGDEEDRERGAAVSGRKQEDTGGPESTMVVVSAKSL